jgi:WD40 repeat protein
MSRGLRFFLIAIALALLSTVSAPAQESAEGRPILRLETGMHTAPIRGAAVDASGKFLVTVSDDRTARLWSLPTGELIRVLRPEIGPGAEGRLFSVAMSPDARFIVTAGSTGFEREKGSSFYVFETATGRLVKRVGGLPEAVNRLAWSPDGHYVATGLLGANGIRLFETKEWREVSRDIGYAGPVYGLGFDGSGRLAAAAFDGNIRLYNPGLQLIAKAKAMGGAQDETHPQHRPDDAELQQVQPAGQRHQSGTVVNPTRGRRPTQPGGRARGRIAPPTSFAGLRD